MEHLKFLLIYNENRKLFDNKVSELYPPALEALKTIISLESSLSQIYNAGFFINKIRNSGYSQDLPEIVYDILKFEIQSTNKDTLQSFYNQELNSARTLTVANPEQFFKLMIILASNCNTIQPDIEWSLQYLLKESRKTQTYCLEYLKVVLQKQSESNISEWLKRILQKTQYKSNCPEIIFYLLNTLEIESKAISFISDSATWKFLLFSILNDTQGCNTKIHCGLIHIMVQNLSNAEKEFALDEEMYFYWRPSQAAPIVDNWNVLTTILKNLEEKQSHLILPTLPALEKLDFLPRPFFYLAIIKILKHENTLVLQWITNYLIVKFQGLQENQHELYNTLIRTFVVETLNNTFLYEKLNVMALQKFLYSLTPNLKKSCLSRILSHQHSSVPFYHLSKCIEDHQCLIAAIEYNLTSTQNRQLRAEISRNLTSRLFSCLEERIIMKDFSEILNHIFARQLFDKLPLDFTLKKIDELRANIPQDDFHIFLDIIKTNSYVFAVQIFNYLADECGLDDLFLTELRKYSSAILHENNFDELQAFFILCPKLSKADIVQVNQRFMDHLKAGEEIFLEYLSIISSTSTVYTENQTIKSLHYDLIQSHKLSDLNQFNSPKSYVYYSTMRKNLAAAGCDFLSTHHLEITINLLEVGPTDVLPSVIEFVIIISKNRMHPLLISIAERCFLEIMGLRKNTNFWRYMESFAQLIFIRGMKCPDWTEKIVFPKSIQMLENATKIHGLGNIIFCNILKQNPIDLMRPEFKDILLNGIIFGDDIPSRDQRIEMETIKLFGEFSQESKSDAMLRAYCISFLLKLQSMHQTPKVAIFLTELHDTIVELLIEKKQRYYANSLHHRYKMRLIQALTVLYQTINDWNMKYLENICDTLENILFFENDQPSIRICIEFFLAMHANLLEFLTKYENCSELKTSGTQSFIVIVWLICCRTDDKKISKRCIEVLTKYTMGQNFSVRLYSQVAIVKLIEKYHSDDETFKQLRKIIESAVAIASGNSLNSFNNLFNDLRFSNLECSNLTSLDTVFHHIPRITGMSEGEIITFEMIQKASAAIGVKLDFISDKTLLNVPQQLRSTDTKILVEEVYDHHDNVQTKIVPVKTIKPDKYLIDSCKATQNMSTEGLIIVASLVSRLPNLGGLSRSCEIFGAKKFIVDNLKIIENKEFQTLSVTAEKWLTITEVKVHQLENYLKNMKTMGYTIVGAEQSKKSISFTDLRFPQKSVLLLGHEKEGIPANLLSILDIAVEIPQFGVVRSLNVHVTGSLFLWKYAEQHKSKSK